jgi:hypothetical protein
MDGNDVEINPPIDQNDIARRNIVSHFCKNVKRGIKKAVNFNVM